MSDRLACVEAIVVPLIYIIPAENIFVTGSAAKRTDFSSFLFASAYDLASELLAFVPDLTLILATMRDSDGTK